MAKARNLIIKGTEGRVAIATSLGQLDIIGPNELTIKLSGLIAKRQALGKELTTALEGAGYEVVAHSHTDAEDLTEDEPEQERKN
jgi:hypothetical protein